MSEYDKFAHAWDKSRQQAWPEFDLFFPLIKPASRVLDLGCGNGRLRKFLPPELVREGDYFGFDVSEKLLEMARHHFPRDAFFRGDFGKNLPFGADNFDWVISIAAFHHLLNKKTQQRYLQEVYRVLKPGGRVFITTWVLPKKYYWANFWRGRVWSKNWLVPFGPERHRRTYRYVSHKDLEKLLEKASFKVERAQQFEDRNFVVLGRKA